MITDVTGAVCSSHRSATRETFLSVKPRNHNYKQECIPVGCVRPASVAITRRQYQGVCFPGVYLPGGYTRHTHPPREGPGTRHRHTPVDRHMSMKTLPFRNFLGGRLWTKKLAITSLMERSHYVIFNDCDCVFYITWNGLYGHQWYCSDCATAISSNLIQKRCCTQKKTHRVNGPLHGHFKTETICWTPK